MKANIKIVRQRRLYSEDFKRELVREFESGKFSILQLSKLHGISNPLIYQWVYKYSSFNEKGSRIIEMKDSSTSRLKEMEQRIKDLERLVGQKQIKVEYLEKMIELAKTELDIDIKKNFDTPRSGGSGKTKG